MTSSNYTVRKARAIITHLICDSFVCELEKESLQVILERMVNRPLSLGKVLGVWPTEDMTMKAYEALSAFLRDTSIGGVR